MTAPQAETLLDLLGALHAERVATWDPDALAININQRRTLVETADRSRFVKVGDVLDGLAVIDVDSGPTDLTDHLQRGPVVLIFFRFAGCPACNIALPYYDRQLAPILERLGARLVAVSPQVPERLKAIKDRHGLSFSVATDPDNALGRRFGVLYTADAASQASALARGGFIGDITGTGTWELPMPAVVVVGQDRVVNFVEVSPDWLVRTEAEPIIDAVRALAAVWA